jgi:hypothetical protein
MPQSINTTPLAVRSTEQLPEDPLARMERQRDIRVETGIVRDYPLVFQRTAKLPLLSLRSLRLRG